MADCEYRKTGQEFCDSCPHRAVFAECLRDDNLVPRSTLVSKHPSSLYRLGLFLLSALAMALIPVMSQVVHRLSVSNSWPSVLTTAAIVFGVVFGIVTAISALIGMYASIWSGRPTKA